MSITMRLGLPCPQRIVVFCAAVGLASARFILVARRHLTHVGLHPPSVDIYLSAENISAAPLYQIEVVVKVAKTLLDLDEALLAEAAATLGTKTKKETVTLALRKVSEDARARRASALEDLLTVADGGGFDYERLADLDQ
jgi:Arc/MetJ family transcription regulator